MITDSAELAELYELEDVIAKLHAVHETDRRHRYRHVSSNVAYWTRVNEALKGIPTEHRQGALCLFANVVYLTGEVLTEAMAVIAGAVATRCRLDNLTIPNDVHLFTVDHDSLVEDFFSVAGPYGWRGRQDDIAERYLKLPSVLLQYLEDIAATPDDAKLERIRTVFARKLWVLLTDNAFSGGSLLSDLQRLRKVLDLFGTDPCPKIMIGALVITDEAIKCIPADHCDPAHLAYGLRFGDEFRIHKKECALFNSEETRSQVQRFCEWFAAQHFSKPDAAEGFTKTLQKHAKKGYVDNFAYGWAGGGYPIILQKNAPTNSVPPLWYPIIGAQARMFQSEQMTYKSPFPRNHSRWTQVTSEDDKRLTRLAQPDTAARINLILRTGGEQGK